MKALWLLPLAGAGCAAQSIDQIDIACTSDADCPQGAWCDLQYTDDVCRSLDHSSPPHIVFDGFVVAGQVVSYGEALTVRSGDITIPRIDLQEPLRLECLHFLECVRERKAPLSDGASGLAVVRVLAAAQTSLEQGGAPVALARQTAAVS